MPDLPQQQPPDRVLAGMAELGVQPVELTPELAERRAAVAELGTALRALTEAAVTSEVPPSVLREAARSARGLAGQLRAARRHPGRPGSVDDLLRGQRFFNPVVGPGNPVAPPMRVTLESGVAIGTCILGPAYEGPLGFAHGGISALLLDQVMGYATAARGLPGVTGRLQVRYHEAVPLGRPLVLRGEVGDVLGVRVAVRGSLGLADEPGPPLVAAEASFLMLRPEQAQRLFGEALG
ncbi:MAG TPA: PaaI family thioesterase [Candidatus Nanopelagicales bacterium]